MFKLEIDTSNDAFQLNDGLHCLELARLLRQVANEILRSGPAGGVLVDVNGSKVGWWSRTPTEG
jgi:hypothetical protein